MIDDVLDDASDERQRPVRLLNGEGCHVLHRVCTPCALGQVEAGVCAAPPLGDIWSMTRVATEMSAADLARARAMLGLSPGELAAEIGMTEPVVRAWEDGSLRIPQQYAIQIVWRAAVAERQAASPRAVFRNAPG